MLKEEWRIQCKEICDIVKGYDPTRIKLIQERLAEFIDISERLQHEEVGQLEDITLRYMQTEIKTWIYEETGYNLHNIY